MKSSFLWHYSMGFPRLWSVWEQINNTLRRQDETPSGRFRVSDRLVSKRPVSGWYITMNVMNAVCCILVFRVSKAAAVISLHLCHSFPSFKPTHQSRPHAVIDRCTYQSEAPKQRWQAWSRPPAAWRRWATATQWFLSGDNNKTA